MPESETPPNQNAGRSPDRDPFRRMGRMALLAHQLMSPLAIISSLAQGLMRRADRLSADDIRLRAEKIWRANQQLQGLTETILSYTRANAGAMSLDLTSLSLRALVRRVCREQQQLEPSRIFDLNIDALPTRYVGDAVLLKQVLMIVLSNAMKYSANGKPIRLEGHENNGAINIVVKDRGMGIARQDIPYVTQAFFRGRNAMKLPGTGLGLSLAQHVLKLHGGNLKIESRERYGTTVTISLPKEGASPSGAS